MKYIHNIDSWYEYFSQPQNITQKANALIKKSRNMRKDIIKCNLDEDTAKKIFSDIIDDTYEFNVFHNMCIFGQIICDDIGDSDRWNSIDMLLNAYIEEFNADNDIFNVLQNIKTNYNHIFNNDEKYAIDMIITSFCDYGGDLLCDSKKNNDINLITNKIDKHINTIFSHINSGNVVDFSTIEEIDGLQKDPHIKKLFVAKNSIKINKKIHDDIYHNSEINGTSKLYLSSLYSRYVADVYPMLFELFILRQKFSKLKGYNNFVEYSTRKCSNNNHDTNFEAIKKMITALDNDAMTEINSVSNTSKNISRSFAQMKYSLIKHIDLMNLVSIGDIIHIIINLMSDIYHLKFVINKKSKKWNNYVLLYDVFDNTDNECMGHIFIDVNLSKVNKICCVELMTGGTYPYNEKKVLPISCVVGNHNNINSYYDVILFAQEISNAIYCLCGKSKINILNGMNCASDNDNFIGTLIEELMWEDSTITKFTKNDVKKTKLIKKLNTIDSALSLKRKCVYALFDHFIYSSEDFLNLCCRLTKEKNFTKLITLFNKFYDSIVSQVLVENNKTSRELHDSIILSCINENSGNKCSILMTEILAKNFYSQNKSNKLFFIVKKIIMDDYGHDIKKKLYKIHTMIHGNDNIKIVKQNNKPTQNNLLFVKNK